MVNKVFTRDYLMNKLDLPEAAIENNIVDNSRWSITHKIVFEDDGEVLSNLL